MTPSRRLKDIVGRMFRGHGGWALSLFLMGLGVKFMMVLKSDSPLPYLDQWEAEAINTYLPWFHHTLSLGDLFKAHNEHRIFWTKLYDLALLILNRQWDSELQMALNAVVHCATLAGFGWLMARLMGRENWPFIWLPLALTLMLPFAWENTLAGFQSQFYFMLIFSLLTIWLLGLSEPWSLRWFLGAAAGVAGWFTMASGFLGAVAVAGICLLDIAKEPRAWRRQLPTLIVCAALTIGGVLLKAHVPRHAVYQAQSVLAFQLSLGKNLAWPSSFYGWLMPLNLLPLILLAWAYAHTKERPAAERMTLAVGAWGILQGAAAAYARGETGVMPASRYMDPESFIMIANVLSIVLLARRYWQQLEWKRFWRVALVLWGIACLWGLCTLTRAAESANGIPDWQARQEKRVAFARAFMATDDEKVLHTRFSGDLPHPDTALLASLLRDKDIREILPACARKPLLLVPDGDNDGPFALNGSNFTNRNEPGERCWGSFPGAGTRTRGRFESWGVGPGLLPYLEIPVAGDLGEAGLSLELVGRETGAAKPVRPPEVPGERWENVRVHAPMERFEILARDESDTKWFAFKEPREMGWLSYWSRRMLEAWRFCVIAGGVCLILSLAAWARSQKL